MSKLKTGCTGPLATAEDGTEIWAVRAGTTKHGDPTYTLHTSKWDGCIHGRTGTLRHRRKANER